METNSRILKINGSVELSEEQQALIQSIYESGKDAIITISGDIRGFGMRKPTDDGKEDIVSNFKAKLIGEIKQEGEII